MSTQRIGVFGGTFDPPHIGHLILAGEALAQLNLQRLLWVLTPNPPHKQDNLITSLEHRLNMLQSMIAHNPKFEISYLEINRPGPHYTVDTINLLKQQEPEAEIILLIGGDSLADLPTWRFAPDLITAVSNFGVMLRPNRHIDIYALESQLPGITSKLHFIEALLQPVSSRELRRRIKSNEMARYYLSSEVYNYIETHQLYR
ncbi:MAG: putative nicotinate-nucleotide adenylyltransferase [Chloroflexi bacterium OLB14]|nr:MAG: putative nicotinate-nucleotide adenylyltransferase [Chloroflexi bacterium OLB14]